MNNSPPQTDDLPAFPSTRWILVFGGIWLSVGLLPAAIVLIGEYLHAFGDGRVAATAGTIGDSFGLANSLFSGAALLFVVWSIRLQQQEIRFARAEWKENTESQQEQVLMMREAASLSAINHIYGHYSPAYGSGDPTAVLSAVAKGHRRWAIRESFSSIDPVFEANRFEQVHQEASQLAELLIGPVAEVVSLHGADYLHKVAERTASLLVDSRAPVEFRQCLWPLYELLRSSPQELVKGESDSIAAFESIAERCAEAWSSHAGAQTAGSETLSSE